MAVEDKHGQTIEKGDTVEFVYAGDPYEAVVEDFGMSPSGVPHVTVTISPEIPHGAVRVTKKADKKATHKKGTAAAEESPAPSQDTEPDPAHKTSTRKGHS